MKIRIKFILKVLIAFFFNSQLKRNNSWKSTAQPYCVQVLHKRPRTYFCRDTHFSTSFLICNVLVAGPDPNPPAMNVSFSVGFRLHGIQSRHLGYKEQIRNAGSGRGGGCEECFHNVDKQPSVQTIAEISSCIDKKARTVLLTVLGTPQSDSQLQLALKSFLEQTENRSLCL